MPVVMKPVMKPVERSVGIMTMLDRLIAEAHEDIAAVERTRQLLARSEA